MNEDHQLGNSSAISNCVEYLLRLNRLNRQNMKKEFVVSLKRGQNVLFYKKKVIEYVCWKDGKMERHHKSIQSMIFIVFTVCSMTLLEYRIKVNRIDCFMILQ